MSLSSPRFEKEKQKEEIEVSLPLDMTLSENECEEDRKKSLTQKDDAASSGDKNRYDIFH